jgi:hypothetical protein
MLYFAVVILMGVGVLVSYFAGVKAQKAWGTPVLVLCFIILIGALAMRIVGGPAKPKAIAEESGNEQAVGRLLGEAAKGLIAEPVKVGILVAEKPFTLTSGRLPTPPSERLRLWEAGLREGLGAGNITDVLSYEDGPTASPQQVKGCGLLVCPVDYVGGVAEALQPRPKVVVYFPAVGGAPSLTEAAVRKMREEGRFDIGIISDGKGGTTVVK